MPQLVLDSLGWAYIGIMIGWTVVFVCGMAFLLMNRELPSIRIRRLPLLFVGLSLLHIYALSSLVGYFAGSYVPCAAEFWVMSIYLPAGIALFQAANSQFLHVASRQKQYARMSTLGDHKPLQQEQADRLANSRWRRILRGVERADKIKRVMVCIAVGLTVNILITFLVFFGSKKFHPGYGLWDWNVQGTVQEVRMKCARGWEWWLSIVWQFFWAWIYAPYMLWKSRGIRDVNGWRLQTICCCLAGLPASPLWLAGLYAPQMMPVNMYFGPPNWFALCIFLMEVITIGFPIVQVFKTHTLRQETLDAIASWEKRQELNEASGSTLAGSDYSPKSPKSPKSPSTFTFKSAETAVPGKASFDSQKSDMLTMVALENALRTNPIPLLQFAALKDFSGENVSFLTHVADWRRAWFSPRTSSTAEHRRHQFVAAARIYAHFASLEFSEFPINISSREMKVLYHVFEPIANMLYRSNSMSSSTASATPFDNVPADSDSTIDLKSGVNLDALGRANLRSVSRMTELGRDDVLADVVVPEEFTEMVFDDAEVEIKYLVLTNTWPKFVNMSCETLSLQDEHDDKQPNWLSRKVLCPA